MYEYRASSVLLRQLGMVSRSQGHKRLSKGCLEAWKLGVRQEKDDAEMNGCGYPCTTTSLDPPSIPVAFRGGESQIYSDP